MWKIPFAPSTASHLADWTSYTPKLCELYLFTPDALLRLSARQLDLEALIAAVRALEALAHERTVAKLKQESDDVPSLGDDPYSLPYDPASVFLLETMVSIACHTPQHIEDLWYVANEPIKDLELALTSVSIRPIVFEHLSALLSAPTQYSVLLIERAVVGLLRLCLILAQKVEFCITPRNRQS
jgi:golgi-specific brefeldin A-resistance guanine nucleotide exchange factor 1